MGPKKRKPTVNCQSILKFYKKNEAPAALEVHGARDVRVRRSPFPTKDAELLAEDDALVTPPPYTYVGPQELLTQLANSEAAVLVLLFGPTGCGKRTAVYTVAQQQKRQVVEWPGACDHVSKKDGWRWLQDRLEVVPVNSWLLLTHLDEWDKAHRAKLRELLLESPTLRERRITVCATTVEYLGDMKPGKDRAVRTLRVRALYPNELESLVARHCLHCFPEWWNSLGNDKRRALARTAAATCHGDGRHMCLGLSFAQHTSFLVLGMRRQQERPSADVFKTWCQEETQRVLDGRACQATDTDPLDTFALNAHLWQRRTPPVDRAEVATQFARLTDARSLLATVRLLAAVRTAQFARLVEDEQMSAVEAGAAIRDLKVLALIDQVPSRTDVERMVHTVQFVHLVDERMASAALDTAVSVNAVQQAIFLERTARAPKDRQGVFDRYLAWSELYSSLHGSVAPDAPPPDEADRVNWRSWCKVLGARQLLGRPNWGIQYNKKDARAPGTLQLAEDRSVTGGIKEATHALMHVRQLHSHVTLPSLRAVADIISLVGADAELLLPAEAARVHFQWDRVERDRRANVYHERFCMMKPK